MHGLEHGRKLARRARTRRRVVDRVLTFVMTIVALGVIAGAGWFGYQVYVENEESDQEERDRRVAEIEQRRAGETVDDVIDELETRARWNGPGNPTFGVGDGEPVDP